MSERLKSTQQLYSKCLRPDPSDRAATLAARNFRRDYPLISTLEKAAKQANYGSQLPPLSSFFPPTEIDATLYLATNFLFCASLEASSWQGTAPVILPLPMSVPAMVDATRKIVVLNEYEVLLASRLVPTILQSYCATIEPMLKTTLTTVLPLIQKAPATPNSKGPYRWLQRDTAIFQMLDFVLDEDPELLELLRQSPLNDALFSVIAIAETDGSALATPKCADFIEHAILSSTSLPTDSGSVSDQMTSILHGYLGGILFHELYHIAHRHGGPVASGWSPGLTWLETRHGDRAVGELHADSYYGIAQISGSASPTYMALGYFSTFAIRAALSRLMNSMVHSVALGHDLIWFLDSYFAAGDRGRLVLGVIGDYPTWYERFQVVRCVSLVTEASGIEALAPISTAIVLMSWLDRIVDACVKTFAEDPLDEDRFIQAFRRNGTAKFLVGDDPLRGRLSSFSELGVMSQNAVRADLAAITEFLRPLENARGVSGAHAYVEAFALRVRGRSIGGRS